MRIDATPASDGTLKVRSGDGEKVTYQQAKEGFEGSDLHNDWLLVWHCHDVMFIPRIKRISGDIFSWSGRKYLMHDGLFWFLKTDHPRDSWLPIYGQNLSSSIRFFIQHEKAGFYA